MKKYVIFKYLVVVLLKNLNFFSITITWPNTLPLIYTNFESCSLVHFQLGHGSSENEGCCLCVHQWKLLLHTKHSIHGNQCPNQSSRLLRFRSGPASVGGRSITECVMMLWTHRSASKCHFTQVIHTLIDYLSQLLWLKANFFLIKLSKDFKHLS